MTPWHLTLALLIALAWGIAFLVIERGLEDFPPLLLSALRFAAASLPFVAFVSRPPARLGAAVLAGLALGVGLFGLLFMGMRAGMPPGLTSVVIQSQAFFTLSLAALVAGERPRGREVAGTALGFLGVALIGGGLAAAVPAGAFALVVAAAACWAVANVAMRRAAGDALQLMVWASLVPVLPLLALSWAFEGGATIATALAGASWGGVAAVVYLGPLATTAAFGAWGYLLARYPAGRVAPVGLAVPVVGMAAAALVEGEAFGPRALAGAALVLLGLAVVLAPRRREAPLAADPTPRAGDRRAP